MTQATYTWKTEAMAPHLSLYAWLMNETRVYPVVIDPTITLDDTEINWDGNVNYEYIVACRKKDLHNPWRISTRQNITVETTQTGLHLDRVPSWRYRLEYFFHSEPCKIATAELILYGSKQG